MVYQAVLFDAGGTLFTIRAGRVERFVQALRRAGVDCDGDLLCAAVDEADRATGWPDNLPRGLREQEDALWLAYCELVCARIGGVADPALRQTLAADARWLRWIEVYPDTRPALERLRGRARLSVLSNNVPSLEEALDTLGLAPYFEDVVISVLAGLSKPDPAVYRLALERLGVAPRAALFVDDLPENVRAARALGLGGVVIDRGGAMRTDLPVVRSLAEVADLALGVGAAEGA